MATFETITNCLEKEFDITEIVLEQWRTDDLIMKLVDQVMLGEQVDFHLLCEVGRLSESPICRLNTVVMPALQQYGHQIHEGKNR